MPGDHRLVLCALSGRLAGRYESWENPLDPKPGGVPRASVPRTHIHPPGHVVAGTGSTCPYGCATNCGSRSSLVNPTAPPGRPVSSVTSALSSKETDRCLAHPTFHRGALMSHLSQGGPERCGWRCRPSGNGVFGSSRSRDCCVLNAFHPRRSGSGPSGLRGLSLHRSPRRRPSGCVR
jgi:hypothetical protein